MCPAHLKQSNFCKPIIDQAAAEAKKKKEIEDEVARVKKEYEERQRKKKEKEEADKEKEKDKDKEKEQKKEDDGKKSSSEKPDASSDTKVRSSPPFEPLKLALGPAVTNNRPLLQGDAGTPKEEVGEEPRVFELHRSAEYMSSYASPRAMLTVMQNFLPGPTGQETAGRDGQTEPRAPVEPGHVSLCT